MVNHRDWDPITAASTTTANHYKLYPGAVRHSPRCSRTWLPGNARMDAHCSRGDRGHLLRRLRPIAWRSSRLPGDAITAVMHALTGLFAGGGIKGGGSSGRPTTTGRQSDRVRLEREAIGLHGGHRTTTIYSALGLDWTEVIEPTPSGRRAFHYYRPLPQNRMIRSQEISPLFA
jgi:hypothetical protein